MTEPATTTAPSPQTAYTVPPGLANMVPAEAEADANIAMSMVTGFEGFSAQPYQDAVGVWTLGYGSTRDQDFRPVCADTAPVTQEQACWLVRRDLMLAAAAVQGVVKVALTADEEAALDDFVYNLGSGALKSSTLLRKLNAGDYEGAAAQFDLWDHAGGKVLAGLLRRREAETKLFETAE